jgi:hypothetical protein
MILRTGAYADAAEEHLPSQPWGTIPYDPDNPPQTANELYLTRPAKITIPDGDYRDIAFALKHVHLVNHQDKADEFAYLIHIHHYVDKDIDYRRSIDLAAIFFDGEPVMVIQDAGRDMRDHSQRFITHPENYKKMCHYIMDLPTMDNAEEFYEEELSDPDTPDLRLFEFYGGDVRTLMGSQPE